LFRKIRSAACFAWKYLFTRDPHFSECDVLAFYHDNDKGDEVSGKGYSKIIDPIIESISRKNYRVLAFTFPGCNLTAEKSFHHCYSYEKLKLKEILINRLIKIKIFKKIFAKYLISPEEEILKKAKPKIVIGIGLSPEICAAAKSLKIPAWEIGHGFGYNAPIPWGWDIKKDKYLPDGIFLYDIKSVNTFEQAKRLKVLLVNHPYYSTLANKSSKLALESEKYDHKIKIRSRGKPAILISLTWGYAGDHGPHIQYKNILENGYYPECLLELIQKSRDEYHWFIRVHPIHLRNRKKYSKLFDNLKELVRHFKNIDWEISSTCPLSSVLGNVKGLICMSSMTSYDADLFGIPVMFMCPTVNPNQEKPFLFDDLFEKGTADYIDISNSLSVTNLEKWLGKITNINKIPCYKNSLNVADITNKILKIGNFNT